MNISQIIYQCIENDRAAQLQLYRLFADHVMQVGLRYARDQAEAKDITQNTFIRIFKSLDSFDKNKGTFKSWISSIAIREAIAIIRKHKSWHTPESLGKIEDDVTENEALEYLTREDILYSMKQLPIQFQSIMQMFYFDELSHKEIAAILHIKESSSRSKLTRAKKLFFVHWSQTNSI